MKLSFATAAIGLMIVSPAHAWGDRGHSIIAEIAQRHLTEKTLQQVHESSAPMIANRHRRLPPRGGRVRR